MRYYCARLLYSTGRYEEARDQFLACLRVQPGFPRALENLGLCYEALRDDAKATEAYLEAIALCKKQHRSERRRGFCLLRSFARQAGPIGQGAASASRGSSPQPKIF
ncbi:MAG: hypothetical protein DMG24_06835 [Acidobacteria bacterium]|nr:MAG: hypothetical protein DMG24_06835 [Acidobacteriota bacterium]